MYYYDYKTCRDLSWKVLISNNIDALPVKVCRICRNLGIVLKYYHPENGEKGSSVHIDNTDYILVDKDLPLDEKRFIIAHELGHILLNHLSDQNMVYYNHNKLPSHIEKTADSFAIRILAPACIINACNISDAAELSRLCCIPEDIADSRFRRIKSLKKRNKFFTSAEEQPVYDAFKAFIDDYNKKHK